MEEVEFFEAALLGGDGAGHGDPDVTGFGAHHEAPDAGAAVGERAFLFALVVLDVLGQGLVLGPDVGDGVGVQFVPADELLPFHGIPFADEGEHGLHGDLPEVLLQEFPCPVVTPAGPAGKALLPGFDGIELQVVGLLLQGRHVDRALVALPAGEAVEVVGGPDGSRAFGGEAQGHGVGGGFDHHGLLGLGVGDEEDVSAGPGVDREGVDGVLDAVGVFEDQEGEEVPSRSPHGLPVGAADLHAEADLLLVGPFDARDPARVGRREIGVTSVGGLYHEDDGVLPHLGRGIPIHVLGHDHLPVPGGGAEGGNGHATTAVGGIGDPLPGGEVVLDGAGPLVEHLAVVDGVPHEDVVVREVRSGGGEGVGHAPHLRAELQGDVSLHGLGAQGDPLHALFEVLFPDVEGEHGHSGFEGLLDFILEHGPVLPAPFIGRSLQVQDPEAAREDFEETGSMPPEDPSPRGGGDAGFRSSSFGGLSGGGPGSGTACREAGEDCQGKKEGENTGAAVFHFFYRNLIQGWTFPEGREGEGPSSGSGAQGGHVPGPGLGWQEGRNGTVRGAVNKYRGRNRKNRPGVLSSPHFTSDWRGREAGSLGMLGKR